jgi:fructose-1,6-bisphosphatase I/sedoheptulose-1,7-bisphosphatase
MLTTRTTLTRFLIEERRRHPNSSGEFNSLILDVAVACKVISRQVSLGALAGVIGKVGETNVQGEQQQKLDVIANDAFIRASEWGGAVAGMVSEELDEPYTIPEPYPKGHYLLLFDPLDGSSNIDVNVSVGSVFSILKAPNPGKDATAEDFLQKGVEQVAAGYAIYGPATALVLTVGRGVHEFTLDQTVGEFFLTRQFLTIPPQASEFAINHANRRFWSPAVRRYVDECLQGSTGPRGKDYNIRWVASMVAEVHRILTRGGVFLYPRDSKDPSRSGRLRLLYEANPVGFIVEQAGGRASTGLIPVLEHQPTAIHERIGLVFGAKDEVELIEAYHRESYPDADDSLDIPLYARRGLFRSGD